MRNNAEYCAKAVLLHAAKFKKSFAGNRANFAQKMGFDKCNNKSVKLKSEEQSLVNQLFWYELAGLLACIYLIFIFFN